MRGTAAWPDAETNNVESADVSRVQAWWKQINLARVRGVNSPGWYNVFWDIG